MTKTKTKSNLFKDKAYWINVWNRFNAGDRFAFEEIYSEYINVLFAYGSKITSEEELVKDSIQDLFIDLYRYKIVLNQPESFEFYLFKSFKRLILKKIKKLNKTRKLTESDFFAFELKFNLEEEYIQKETEKSRLLILQKILNDLSESSRELLFYKFNSNLTYKEIGVLTEMKTDTVKKQIYRIISGLRESFNSRSQLYLILCSIA